MTNFFVEQTLMKNLLILLSIILFSGCAGSATHEVMTSNTASDNEFTCKKLKQEIILAQAIIDGVIKDKEDISGADVIDGVLYFPFNLVAKHENYNAALEAADRRIATCRELERKKGCEENIALTNEISSDLVNRMSALKDLHKRGLIDDKEYERSKAELLNYILKHPMQEKERLEGVSEETIKVEQNLTTSEVNEIGRDGSFIAYDDGTVLDTKSNLMWWSKSLKKVMGWSGAQIKSRNFRGGGYSDWFIPSIDELKTIYNKNSNSKYKTVDFITLTTPYLISRNFGGTDQHIGGEPSIKLLNFKNGRDKNGRLFINGRYSFSLLPVRKAN
jgi:hypothetical protein